MIGLVVVVPVLVPSQEARDSWNDPAWRKRMATQMQETIYRGFEHKNLLQLFTGITDS